MIARLGIACSGGLSYPLALKQELRHQYQIISELRAEIKTLQTDNLKLYEKVRYMQSYRHEMSAEPGQGISGVGLSETLGGSVSQDFYGSGSGTRTRDGDLAKYRDKYEQSMNPFEAFRGRVSRIPDCHGSSDAHVE